MNLISAANGMTGLLGPNAPLITVLVAQDSRKKDANIVLEILFVAIRQSAEPTLSAWRKSPVTLTAVSYAKFIEIMKLPLFFKHKTFV